MIENPLEIFRRINLKEEGEMRIENGLLCGNPTAKDVIDGKLIIPEGTEQIREFFMFSNYRMNLPKIKEIILPESLKRIDEFALSHLFFIDKINIPKNVEFVGKNCFSSSITKDIYIYSDNLFIHKGIFNFITTIHYKNSQISTAQYMRGEYTTGFHENEISEFNNTYDNIKFELSRDGWRFKIFVHDLVLSVPFNSPFSAIEFCGLQNHFTAMEKIYEWLCTIPLSEIKKKRTRKEPTFTGCEKFEEKSIIGYYLEPVQKELAKRMKIKMKPAESRSWCSIYSNSYHDDEYDDDEVEDENEYEE